MSQKKWDIMYICMIVVGWVLVLYIGAEISILFNAPEVYDWLNIISAFVVAAVAVLICKIKFLDDKE